MKSIKVNFLIPCLFIVFISSCCKDKNTCKNESINIRPFIERFYIYRCNNNDAEYTYVFNNSSQIESLRPTCFFTSPVAFPINESGMKYFIVGRLATHYNDTFQTSIYKDTCDMILTYDLKLIQRDTTPFQFPGIASMFCAVENIPADYKVEVKYKYVPLP